MYLKLIALISCTFLVINAHAQQSVNEVEQIWQHYNQYREASIKSRLFKHSDLLPLMEKHIQTNLLQNEILGESVEKRSIHHLKAGTGKTKVLLWSQMHGDEATATMALFDLFNFLSAKDQFDPVRNRLLSQLELHFVPMLNPDGAQIWTRRNKMNIDLNRDARNLATPEARALMNLGKQLKPEFGFNLHDQSTLYAAGKSTKNPATISFLAPAYNTAKEMNAVRTKAVQVIGSINKAIQTKIPNQVAKYNDTHDSTCFGDTFQEMGISTMLIESGGFQNDPDKQFIRKVNFYGLITALDAIASQSYANEATENYWALPNNNRNLHDVIVRNVNVASNRIDIGINRNQRLSPDFLTMHYAGTIAKVGGLDSAYAYEELDGGGLNLISGRVKMIRRAKWEKLSADQQLKFLKKGFLFVKWRREASPVGVLPNSVINLTNGEVNAELKANTPANFILTKNKKPAYAIINGFLVDLSLNQLPKLNTIGY